MWRVWNGFKTRYVLDRKHSIPSFLSFVFTKCQCTILHVWRKKQVNKPCFQTHWENKNCLPSSRLIFLSPCSIYLFTWKINRKIVTETQRKVSTEVMAVGLEWRLLERRAQLLPGPISNIAILAVWGLSVVMNTTASGLCTVPFIIFWKEIMSVLCSLLHYERKSVILFYERIKDMNPIFLSFFFSFFLRHELLLPGFLKRIIRIKRSSQALPFGFTLF